MFTLIDLVTQVQKWLPVRFGGTGNPRGWATDAVMGAYINGTGSTMVRGTVVELANYVTAYGHIGDSRIKPTSAAKQQTALGVIMGRFRTDDPVNEWEDADCEDGDVCAVVISGKAHALVEGTVAVGQYAYTAATDGQAMAGDYLESGGFAMWESAGTTRQWLRVWGASSTPGLTGGLLAVFGDGVTNIQAGTLVDVQVPIDIRLLHWSLLSTYSGSISVDIYVDDYANFPPTNSPDSITQDTGPPTITSGVQAEGDCPVWTDSFGMPHGWRRDIDAGQVLRCIVESASSVKQVSLLLTYTRR